MSVHVRPDRLRNGGHEIYTEFNGQTVVLVRVRPVGTLEMGDLAGFFSPTWVPHLIEALQMAQSISAKTGKPPKGVETGHDMGLTHACETFPQYKGKL